jgi:peptidoglycan hydrolase-like protein with peptidoglycan-binding domain
MPALLSCRRLAVALAVAGTALAGAVLPTSASMAVVTQPVASPPPATPTGLPSALEGLARYVPANSCDPTAKPGAKKLGDLLLATYPTTTYGISRTCGTDPLPTSEHYDGRAVDWMTSVRTTAGKARAGAVLSWLLATDATGNQYANARRLGIMYIIWNNRIWGSYRAADGWRAYSTCASHPEQAYDTTCHRDHIHFSFSWEGAMGRTSFWTKTPAAVDYGPCRTADLNWASPYRTARTTACPSYPKVTAPAGAGALLKTLTTYSGMYVARASSGPVVRAVQQAVGTTVDGSFGAGTQTALTTWQGTHGLVRTGVVDPATWRALLAANAPAPATTPTTTPSSPTPTTTVNPLTQYLGTVLREGSRGPAVTALQKRLRITADGWFGPRTKTAVNVFKRAHHLPADGVVRRACWKALGA